MELEPLEAAVLDSLLDGDDPVRVALRRQRRGVSVASREVNGAGFFTRLALDDDARAARAPLPPGRAVLGQVDVAMRGLVHGAGAILICEDGLIDMIEGFSYGEPWPALIERFAISRQT